MSHSEDRHLDFVLKHYKEGAFDTQKAIESFRNAQGVGARPRRRSWVYMAAATSAAAALLFGVFLFMGNGSRQWTEITASASSRTVILPDGTDVTLASGASLSYRMKAIREVKMEGKVFFDVARDEERPFEIKAESAFVKVLGTEFMVDASKAGAAKVYVEEGKVFFAKAKDSEGVILTDGMGARVEEGDPVPVVDADPDANSIAWKRGTFIFDQTPLKEVLTCLSDYYKVSFVANDLSKKLSGEFYTDDLDLIISLIESALDVNIIVRR